MTNADCSSSDTKRQNLLEEARWRFGACPTAIGGVEIAVGNIALAGEEFLSRVGDGVSLYYRKGAGVTCEAPDETDPRELDLWLNGSVHAAIAAINGLFPIHASAVAHRGRVFAFTGPSGSGKSTLAAALVQRGLALFCDDTLILDPDSEHLCCLPGHKRLRLWPEGLELAGIEGRGEVAPSYPKHFASDAGAGTEDLLPLAAMVRLEDGNEAVIEPVLGAERFALLADDHYTVMLHEWASGMERAERFEFQAELARAIPAFRLVRPFDPTRFGDMVETVSRWIEEF